MDQKGCRCWAEFSHFRGDTVHIKTESANEPFNLKGASDGVALQHQNDTALHSENTAAQKERCSVHDQWLTDLNVFTNSSGL